MSDYGGRLIRATEPTVSTTTASGIWTIEEALKYKQAGTWPVQQTADPNFNQTVLLLHGDGTNGAQNNTFLDSSTNNFTITRNGNTTQGTFSPFSAEPGKWGNYFSGTSDYLNLASMPAIGTGDFTITCWVWPQLYARGAFHVGGLTGAVNGIAIHAYNSGSGGWNLYAKNTQTVSNSGIPPLNTWYHIAVVRSGTTTTLYVNGTSLITVTSDTTNYSQTALAIGGFFGTSNLWQGYISDFRIVIGTALHTGNFTPPTAPSTAVSGTSVLTCQDNRFVDKASPPNAITVNGAPRVTPFSPFAPTAEYDAGTNGGSGYFDGSNTRLNTPTSSQFNPAGDFTIGLWFYPNSALTINQNLIGNLTTNAGTDWLIQMVSGTLQFYTNGTTVRISSATAIRPFQWNYISLTRSSNVISAHANGTLINTYSQSGAFGSATKTIEISNATSKINGYLSGMILIDGTVDTTVPTAPPTNVSGTSLLLNFTNAGIIDNTGKNNLETVGNAQIDTTTKKYGTGSLEFDGTGDRLVFPSTPDLQLGTGNFTIEGWVYRADTNIRGVFQLSGTAGGLQPNTTTNLALGSDTGAVWRIYANNSAYNSATTWSINTWYHFALVRNSGTTTLYINGTSVISQADTVNYTGQNLCVGGFYDTTFLMNGFIDDLRITKGVARYTANFTPPAAAFQDK